MVMDYTQHNPLGWLAPLYFLALPLVDTVYVSVLRFRAGRKIYHGSPDHFPLRLRRRLGGSTLRTVLVTYMTTLWVTGATACAVLGALVWLARVPMEAS